MYTKALNAIKKYNMLQKGDTVLIGASGGADSTALMHFLVSLRDAYSLNLYAVYVNHSIRGSEAVSDGRFVEELCKSLDVEFFSEKVDVPKFSLENKISAEEGGRILRYRIFRRILQEKGGGKIALGHNLNDNAETLLMRLARGTGPKGLEGIPPVRGNIIRPLIECERELIENYCAENHLDFRTDSTNLSGIYSRNKIRLNVVPELLKLNPSALKNILKTSALIKEENSYIEKEAEKAYTACVLSFASGVILLDVKKLESFHAVIIKNVLRKALLAVNGSIKDISSVHTESILALISKGTGKRLNLPGGIVAETVYDRLKIFLNISDNKKENFCTDLEINSAYNIESIQKKVVLTLKNEKINKIDDNLCTKAFNYDKIKGSLQIRTRKTGDFIRIKGADEGKSLKTFFIDSKIPRFLRDSIPLIACGSDILWVCGYRVSDYYKWDENTLNTLFITLEDDSLT